jgi:hypothetical protein
MFPELVIQQYVYEAECWDRLLNYILQENICFKNRLAEVAGSELDGNVLSSAEKFQDEFLSQDRIISYLTDEVSIQRSQLGHAIGQDGLISIDLMMHHKRLRNDIYRTEQLFMKLKDKFLLYLETHLAPESKSGQDWADQ